nr:MAG TPA: hypothetical protein [Caudoviricetes sp.]
MIIILSFYYIIITILLHYTTFERLCKYILFFLIFQCFLVLHNPF